MRVTATAEDAGRRLDHFLQARLPEFSRSRIQDWIRAGRVRIQGSPTRPSVLLKGGEVIDVEPQPLPSLNAHAEDLPLDILYEDPYVIAVNKPAGMAVHAGAGIHSGTLVNALLHRFQRLSAVGGEERPGIVHRLDRFTSGVMLIARTDEAHRALAGQFAGRSLEKIYLALVHGVLARDRGRFDKPVARDPVRRARMTARLDRGRTALTEYHVLERFERHTFAEIALGTGRTHQIRVHFADAGCPVVGDKLYGAPAEPSLGRYFLHSHRIAFQHPVTGKAVSLSAPLTPELQEFLQGIRSKNSQSSY